MFWKDTAASPSITSNHAPPLSSLPAFGPGAPREGRGNNLPPRPGAAGAPIIRFGIESETGHDTDQTRNTGYSSTDTIVVGGVELPWLMQLQRYTVLRGAEAERLLLSCVRDLGNIVADLCQAEGESVMVPAKHTSYELLRSAITTLVAILSKLPPSAFVDMSGTHDPQFHDVVQGFCLRWESMAKHAHVMPNRSLLRPAEAAAQYATTCRIRISRVDYFVRNVFVGISTLKAVAIGTTGGILLAMSQLVAVAAPFEIIALSLVFPIWMLMLGVAIFLMAWSFVVTAWTRAADDRASGVMRDCITGGLLAFSTAGAQNTERPTTLANAVNRQSATYRNNNANNNGNYNNNSPGASATGRGNVSATGATGLRRINSGIFSTSHHGSGTLPDGLSHRYPYGVLLLPTGGSAGWVCIDARPVNKHAVIVGLDLERRINLWNTAATDATGHTEQMCVGAAHSDRLSSRDPVGRLARMVGEHTTLRLKNITAGEIEIEAMIGDVRDIQGDTIGHCFIAPARNEDHKNIRTHLHEYLRLELAESIESAEAAAGYLREVIRSINLHGVVSPDVPTTNGGGSGHLPVITGPPMGTGNSPVLETPLRGPNSGEVVASRTVATASNATGTSNSSGQQGGRRHRNEQRPRAQRPHARFEDHDEAEHPQLPPSASSQQGAVAGSGVTRSESTTHMVEGVDGKTVGGGSSSNTTGISTAQDLRLLETAIVRETSRMRELVRQQASAALTAAARDMATQWEWTSGERILSTAARFQLQKASLGVEQNTPPSFRLPPSATRIIKTVIGIAPSHCQVQLMHTRRSERVGRITITVNLSPSPEFGNPLTPMPNIRLHRRQSVALDNLRRFVTGEKFDFDAVVREINRDIESGWGSLEFSNDDAALSVHFPCLRDEEGEKDAHNAGHSTTNVPRDAARFATAATVCDCNVATCLRAEVDRHNLAMMLLGISGVSLVVCKDLDELMARLSTCDMAIFDNVHRGPIRLLCERNKLDIVRIPVVSEDAQTQGDEVFIRIPLEREAVHSVVVRASVTVAERKRKAREAKEREEVLLARHDASWTRGELLGRGTFGVCYAATNDVTGGHLAVKHFELPNIARDDPSAVDEFMASLINEIKILAGLEHPNIVHYFNCEQKDNGVYLFMELCEGSLHDVLKKRMACPPEVYFRGVPMMMKQILSAVSYLHGKGIIHRDLKPQNILVKGDKLKLTDFGTAQELKPEESARGTQGTLRFMAPEVYLNMTYNHTCDIWSIGCILCELLDVRLTFMQPGKHLLLEHLAQSQIDLNAYATHVSEDARDFIDRCLQVQPERRATANSLLNHPYILKADTSFHLTDLTRFTVSGLPAPQPLAMPLRDPQPTQHTNSGQPQEYSVPGGGSGGLRAHQLPNEFGQVTSSVPQTPQQAATPAPMPRPTPMMGSSTGGGTAAIEANMSPPQSQPQQQQPAAAGAVRNPLSAPRAANPAPQTWLETSGDGFTLHSQRC